MLRFYLSLQLHGTAVFTLVRYELGSEITTQQVFHGLCCTLLDRKGLYSHLVIVGWALPTISPIHREFAVDGRIGCINAESWHKRVPKLLWALSNDVDVTAAWGRSRAIECSGWRA
jgi:hypothetical protein